MGEFLAKNHYIPGLCYFYYKQAIEHEGKDSPNRTVKIVEKVDRWKQSFQMYLVKNTSTRTNTELIMYNLIQPVC